MVVLEKLKIKQFMLRTIFGLIWIIAGFIKIVLVFSSLFFAKDLEIMFSETIKSFAKNCIIPQYAELIASIAIPHSTLIFLTFGFIEFIVGILILYNYPLSKIGLILAILTNLLYLPLTPPFTIITNATFIIFQIYALLKEDLRFNIISLFLKKFK